MPSQLHDAMLLLFRNRPELAPELLRDALNVTLPDYSEARLDSAADVAKSVQIAAAAQFASLRLDSDRARLYFDLVLNSLSEAARRALQTMNPIKYEYQSDFARKYYGQGLAEGRADLVALVVRLLSRRFGELDDDIRNRVSAATTAELQDIGERLLTAQTLQEAIGSH